jgi:hypothetical protein
MKCDAEIVRDMGNGGVGSLDAARQAYPVTGDVDHEQGYSKHEQLTTSWVSPNTNRTNHACLFRLALCLCPIRAPHSGRKTMVHTVVDICYAILY